MEVRGEGSFFRSSGMGKSSSLYFPFLSLLKQALCNCKCNDIPYHLLKTPNSLHSRRFLSIFQGGGEIKWASKQVSKRGNERALGEQPFTCFSKCLLYRLNSNVIWSTGLNQPMCFLLGISPRKEMVDHKAMNNCLTMAGFEPMTCGLDPQLTYKAR